VFVSGTWCRYSASSCLCPALESRYRIIACAGLPLMDDLVSRERRVLRSAEGLFPLIEGWKVGSCRRAEFTYGSTVLFFKSP
jgi:hypothetical protein